MYTQYTIHNLEEEEGVFVSGLANAPERRPAQAGGMSAELFARWTAYIDASPRTVETYSRNIRHFRAYLLQRGISRPQREDVIAYREELKRDHKPATVQGYLTAVKLFFRWTAQEGLYPDVAGRVKGAKTSPGHKKDALTTKQVGRMLSEIDRSTLRGLRDYALLALMVTTGLREISVAQADVGDIRNVGDAAVLFYRGKGQEEKAEYVKLAGPVEEALRAYLAARGEKDGRAPLFCSLANRNGGGRLTTRSISRVAKERLLDAGLASDRLTGHSLRHTAATLNLLNGGTLEETRQLLGHANLNTTLLYAHALTREKNDSEARIARAIFE